MSAIDVAGLTKTYRSRHGAVAALAGLDLEVPEGGVFGCLGANGAGKTTLIRAVVGHLRATSGSVSLFGVPVPTRLDSVIDRVGALVEQPSFFPNFSGRRNLHLLARSRGFSRKRADETLERVGLAERADSRFATYSLGMRQRLGVAAALLKDPALLVLDEPANGLDPAGIIEIRSLLRGLGDEGRTVFVSSHILSEVEQTCDRVAIIAHGRCIASGTVAELVMGSASKYRVGVPGGDTERAAAASLLARAGFEVANDEEGKLVVGATREDAPRVTRTLADAGIYLDELDPIARSLEDAFIELTGDGGTDQGGGAQ